MANGKTLSQRANALGHRRIKGLEGRLVAKFQPFNLADADRSVSFGIGTGKKPLTVMNALTAMTRCINGLLGAWLVALSGGRLSTLVARSLRLRRLAGTMLSGDLTPPAPVRLQIETTDVCNLRCIHCRREELESMNTLTMPLETFARIVADIEPFYATIAGFG